MHFTAACAGVVAGQLGIFGLKPSDLNDLLAGEWRSLSTACLSSINYAKHATLADFRIPLLCLAGTRVDMSTSEGAFKRSFQASFGPEDLEIALQLLHALFHTK